MSNETQREALSALMDGELPAAEAERLLDAMRDDPELREQWRRHHALSALLSGGGAGPDATHELAGRIAKALDRDPVVLKPPRRVATPASRPVIGMAIAAGIVLVAVVVVLGLRGDEAPAPGEAQVARIAPTPTESAPQPAVTPVAVPSPPVTVVASTRLTWNGARPGVEDRLNGYLLNHNEYLAGGVRGMLPYARVVGYDPRN